MPPIGGMPTSPKKKVRVRKPKTRVTVVAPADRVSDRVEARRKQLKVSVKKAGDAPQDRAQDTARAEKFKRTDKYVQTVKDAAPKPTKILKVVKDQPVPDSKAELRRVLAGGRRSKRVPAPAMNRMQTVTAAPALKVLDQTTRPLHAVAAAAKEDVKTVKAKGIGHYLVHGSGGRSVKAAKRGIQNKDKSTFSDVFTEAGWKPKSGLGKFAKAAASLTADVVADPLTYATGGTSSVAESAARTAAKEAERKAVRSIPAKEAADKAATQATKRGASTKKAKAAGKAAARTHARRAGQKAGEAASVGKTTNKGVTVRFAGMDVPGVARATSAAKRVPRAVARKTGLERTRPGRAVDRGQQKVRDTSRNLASDFNPAIAPAGVDRTAYQSARRSARTARAGAQRGTYRAGQRAIAFKKAIGKKNYEKVLDAIETGDIPSLPKALRGPAHELSRDFAKMRKAELRAGLKVGDRPNYVKHLRIQDGPSRGGVPSVGSKRVDPGFGKTRIEGTIAEKNAAEPGAYSTSIPDIYLNRGAESAVARSKAKLNQSMIHAGRKPDRTVPIKHQLGDNETLYKVDGANLVKVDPKSSEARNLQKGDRYVILNEKLVSRTRGTVAAAAERSTSGVFFDRAQGVWKLAATQVNPGYHVRNFAGEAQNAYLAEGPITLGKNTVAAARALRQLGRDEDALRVLGKKPKEGKYTDLIRTGESVGAVRAGQLGREVQDMLGGASRKAKPAKARRGTLRRPARVLKNVEDVFRLATYKGGIDRGLTPERAMERASRNHFDYGDLTPLERTTLRRIAPFWTFSARNIPLQARTLLTNPSKFANYQKVREELQNLFGVPDDWENDLSESDQRGAPFPVKIVGKTYNISLGPSGLPLTDLNEFPSTGNPIKQADEWMNRAMSMLTPAAKTPVELWANFSFFFRDSIERDTGPLAPAPSWVSVIPKKYRDEVGITPNYMDKRTGKTGWGAPAKVVYALGVLPGPANFANRLATDSERPGQGKAAKSLAYLGPRIRQNDPLSVQIQNGYDADKKLTKKLNALRQQKHPDNTALISAANPTPEFTKLSAESKKLKADILAARTKRGDKNLPKKKYKVRKTSGFDFGGGSQDFDFSGGSADFDFGG